MICSYQVTKSISTRHSSTIASSVWSPCNFGLFTDLAISVFREMSMNAVLTQILTSLEYGLLRCFMTRTGVRISAYWNFVIHQIFPEFLQPLRDFRILRVSPFFLWLFFIVFGVLLAWVSSGRPDLSSTVVDHDDKGSSTCHCQASGDQWWRSEWP